MYISNDVYASYRLLGAELKKNGYKFDQYESNGRTILQFSKPGRYSWITSASRIYYPLIHGFSIEIANNKTHAYVFMDHLNLPVAYTKTLEVQEQLSDDEMQQLISDYGRLVVKPQQASLSHGLSLDIFTVEDLKTAITKARSFNRYSSNILIQQFVEGEEIRFTLLEGKVIGAILRRTARVVGDGHSSVSQLIEAENQQRQMLDGSMVKYPLLDEELIDKRHLNSQRILAIDEVLELNKSTMIKGGASMYNILSDVHPSYIKLAEKSVEALGAKFIVADFMVRDYTVPYEKGNAYFNEFNIAPVLKLFYSCRDGHNLDIVPMLVDVIDRTLKK